MEFNPSLLFGADGGEHVPNSSLIILNQPIKSFDRLKTVWENTSYRICADGGANRLLDVIRKHEDTLKNDLRPDLIHGDLDSIDDDVRRLYESHGVQVSQDDDQYRTDFAKCMLVLTKGYKTTNRPDLDSLGRDVPLRQSQTIAVMSTMSGRLDQAIGLLHEMLRETLNHLPASEKPITLYFISEQSVSFVLPIGKNVIRGIDPAKGVFRRHAGILPIYGPAKITIKGFEWDVTDWETMMGADVSTSNHVLGDEVVIKVMGQSVLFTIELSEPALS